MVKIFMRRERECAAELKIKELRRLAEKELGARFDIREFHDAVLADGPLPLDILERQIRAWIERKRK